MTKRMLIDTTHAEETRVVVLDGNRLDDYDVETSSKKQIKGNIYLAKIVRIEPSLQAAFVEYGGNRHGFLAFSEIHPDYYQIPVADRERLIALQEEEARAEEARAEREDDGRDDEGDEGARDGDEGRTAGIGAEERTSAEDPAPEAVDPAPDEPRDELYAGRVETGLDAEEPGASGAEARAEGGPATEMPLEIDVDTVEGDTVEADTGEADPATDDRADEPAPEVVGGESADDGQAQRRTARFLRQYKIQEVMRRRQILLVQVVKEERGNKGAALTTYISLAGRFCVLMPNSLRGGGVSRKITSAADRRRLKEITAELEIPRGMGMIVRTAGAQRPRPEIRRDCEYLLRTWDDIRETTLASIAPCLVYEEASLIKRAIRDVYTRDVEEIVVDGEPAWRAAREFMRTLMPANAGKVNLWRDPSQTLFSAYGVEHHLDAMLLPTVQLRSGGYLVINQTEALVAIDVNSGRSTRERGIEETAFRTNLEAADEVSRQLRLRDLAGLIVIDFIDMEVRRNNAMVERRLKDALRNDRARIQVGTISHFGLMEMSRQRLRPSLAESSFVPCPHCAGSGFMRGTESSALHVLRAIEEEAGKRKAAEILVHAASSVALYVLNNKRSWLQEIESRHRIAVHLAADDSLVPPALRIDRVRPYVAAPEPVEPAATATRIPIQAQPPAAPEEEDQPDIADVPIPAGGSGAAGEAAAGEAAAGETEGDEAGRRRKRRRRRRGGRREDGTATAAIGTEADEGSDADGDEEEPGRPVAAQDTLPQDAPLPQDPLPQDGDDAEAAPSMADSGPRGRRRRGGRRSRPDLAPGSADADVDTAPIDTATAPRAPRPYVGPTPADPFAGSFDIFEMIEREAEETQGRATDPSASAASLAPASSTPASSIPGPVPVAEPSATTAPPNAEPGEPELLPLAQAVEPSTPSLAEPLIASVGSPEETDAKLPAASLSQTPVDSVADPVAATDEPPAKAARVPKPRKPRASRAKKPVVAEAAEAAAPPVEPVLGHADEAPIQLAAAAPEPVVPEPATPEPAAPQPTMAEPGVPTTQARDPSIVPPVVIGEDTPAPVRRTGWWKR